MDFITQRCIIIVNKKYLFTIKMKVSLNKYLWFISVNSIITMKYP